MFSVIKPVHLALTLGSHLRVPPEGSNLGFQPRVPPSDPGLGSYLRVPPSGPTLGSWIPGPTLGSCGPLSPYALISSGQVVYFRTVSSLCRSLSLIIQWCAAFFQTRLRHSCFIVNFVNFLKTTFLQNNFGRLLLSLCNVFAISINLILFSQW